MYKRINVREWFQNLHRCNHVYDSNLLHYVHLHIERLNLLRWSYRELCKEQEHKLEENYLRKTYLACLNI